MEVYSPPFFIRLLKHLLSRFGKVTVSGAEYLDDDDGAIVVCNHVGWADPLWLGYATLPRTLYQMAKKELFENPVMGWLVRQGGGFPIDRTRTVAATIRPMAFAPRSGGGLPDTLSDATIHASVNNETWLQAEELAQKFLSRVMSATGFSHRFRPCIDAMELRINTARARIERLG